MKLTLTQFLMIVRILTINAAPTPIINNKNQLCLSANSTTGVILAYCNLSLNAQVWSVTKTNGNNTYNIENLQTGTCLYVDYPITSGTPLGLSNCTSPDVNDAYRNHVVFELDHAPPASVEVRSNQWKNLCVDGSDGVTARLAECDSTALVEQWFIPDGGF